MGYQMRRNRIAVAVIGGVLLGITGMSGAADAAKCGTRPDGKVNLEDPTTWASPGEVVSYINSGLGVHASGVPGETVRLVCAGPNP